MRRMLLFCLLLCLFPVYVFAGVGSVDNRYYVTDEMWATHPYNKFVELITLRNPRTDPVTKRQIYTISICTAQYVSENLILSAEHCVQPGAIYEIENYKKERIPVSLVSSGKHKRNIGLGDWAVWKIDDPKFYNHDNDFFNIDIPKQNTSVINAGFGWMRILTIEEIRQLRVIFREILKEKKKSVYTLSIADVRNELETRIKNKNIPPLNDNRLKASKCNILLEDCSLNMTGACQNKLISRSAHYPYILGCSCDSWGGNSGGGYISTNGTTLYGTSSFGGDSFYDTLDFAYLVSARQFRDVITKLKNDFKVQENTNTSQPTATTNTEPTKKPTTEKPATTTNTEPTKKPTTEKPTATTNTEPTKKPDTEKPATTTNTESAENTVSETPPASENTETAENTASLEEEIAEQENIVNGLETSLNNNLDATENMSDKDFLNFLDNMVRWQKEKELLEQLKQAYDEAKAKEQSFENRALAAATVAATGIGGMELMQGLAEQSADKDAAADMAAYIETMRCTYGEDKQVKAGTTEIELPGANDEQLMNLRAEYLALAADLKERKEALGMKPGIESEEILDRASSGLYDDESIGINNGAYASLYRSQMLQSEADKKKIDDAASTSKNRVTGGAIAAGAGVVVGIAGNSLINGKLGEMIKNKKGNKVSDKTNDSTIKKMKSRLKTTGLKNVDKLNFDNLDLSGMSSVIDKIDFSSMKNLSGKNATEVLDTKDNTSFASSLSKILGDKNAALFQ